MSYGIIGNEKRKKQSDHTDQEKCRSHPGIETDTRLLSCCLCTLRTQAPLSSEVGFGSRSTLEGMVQDLRTRFGNVEAVFVWRGSLTGLGEFWLFFKILFGFPG